MKRDSFRRKPLPGNVSFLDRQILTQSFTTTLVRTVKHRGGIIEFVHYSIERTADAPRKSLRIKILQGDRDE
jgi:hypothetical protein